MEAVNTLSSTPKKTVKPPAKKPDISNTCRLCYVDFKSSGRYRVSTENLFKIPQKSEVSSTPLAELVGKHVGVVIPQATKKSSRVCAKCALLLTVRRARSQRSHGKITAYPVTLLDFLKMYVLNKKINYVIFTCAFISIPYLC